jgi:spore coat-associated protein N
LKKKLGLGMASAALGLSLVGGGTFAYFSDEATIHNGFEAGTLDLVVKSYGDTSWPVNFDLSNLRPGDKVERTFDLKNNGSLAIEDTYMSFVDAVVTNPLQTGAAPSKFLDALKINYFVETVQNGNSDIDSVLVNAQDLTLSEALVGAYAGKIKPEFLKGTKLNLTPEGIDSGKITRIRVAIEFPNTPNEAQNDLQGMKATLNFKLDARQVMANKFFENNTSPNGKITGNGLQGGNETIDSTGTGLVDPDITDNDAWVDAP